VARQCVVQHFDEHCDPARLRCYTSLHHVATRQPHHHSHVTILPRRTPVMDCVVILEADDTSVTLVTWRRVEDM